MNQFSSYREAGMSAEELQALLHEKVHEEKLWLLRQPVVIPGMFQKRLQKIRALFHDYKSLSSGLINDSQSTENKLLKVNVSNVNFDQFLANYEPWMAAFRLDFMNSVSEEVLVSSLEQMIALELEYYRRLLALFPEEDVSVPAPSVSEKIPAHRLRLLISSQDFAQNPEVQKELARLRSIVRIYKHDL